MGIYGHRLETDAPGAENTQSGFYRLAAGFYPTAGKDGHQWASVGNRRPREQKTRRAGFTD